MRNLEYYIAPLFKTFIFSLLAFLAPIKGLLFSAGFAVVLDTIIAIYAVQKLQGWSAFESNKLFNVCVKTFFYTGSILFAFLIDKFIIDTNLIFEIELFISKTVTVFWIYIEAKSMDETSKKLGNRSFYVIIKDLLNKAKDIKKDINEIKN